MIQDIAVIPEDDIYTTNEVMQGGKSEHFENSFPLRKLSNRLLKRPSIDSIISTFPAKRNSNKYEMRTHKSATVLISVVILFLLTHFYRIALKIFEVSTPNTNTMETFMMCFAKSR